MRKKFKIVVESRPGGYEVRFVQRSSIWGGRKVEKVTGLHSTGAVLDAIKSFTMQGIEGF